MSDLALREGDIAATGALRSGEAWANGVQGVAGAISKTMGDLAAYAEEQPAREARNAQLKASTAKNNREAEYEKLMQTTGGQSPDAVVQTLRDKGFHEKAAELKKTIDKAREDAIDLSIKQMNLAQQQLGQAALLMDSARTATGAEAETYASVLPKVRELVGPDLAKSIPDQYDPSFVEQATTWGMSMKDKLGVRADAAKALRDNLKDARDGDTHFTAALSTWLGTADSQEDWDDAIANAKGLGAAPETIAKFGSTYSPEAVERAKVFGAKKDDGPKAGSFESFMTSFAKSKGKAANDLTPAELLTGRRQWEAAGWKPEKPSGGDANTTKLTEDDYRSMRAQIEDQYAAQLKPTEGGDDQLSMEARNTAMRWRSTQLEQLDKAARASGLNPSKLSKSLASLGENPSGWHPPMAPGRAPAPPMQGPPASAAPSRPPVNFRQPPPAPTSSQQPRPMSVRIPDGPQFEALRKRFGAVVTFPTEEAAQSFMAKVGLSLKAQ